MVHAEDDRPGALWRGPGGMNGGDGENGREAVPET